VKRIANHAALAAKTAAMPTKNNTM